MRRAVAGWLSAMMLAFLVTAVSASPSAAATDPQLNVPGAHYLASCAENARTLGVLVVLDRSGSLTENDPSGERYEGLAAALSALSNVKRLDGEQLAVEVAISSFATGYEPAAGVSPWRQINGTDSAAAIDTLVRDARERTSAIPSGNTEYEEALRGALGDLTGRGDDTTCRVMLWFTDGEWTSPEDAPALCTPGGLVDEIREAGIAVVALRVMAEGSGGGAALEWMAIMALGSYDGTSCGTTPIPEGAAPGVFLSADPGDIAWLFGGVVDILDGCTPTGERGLLVDPGITRVRIALPTAGRVSELVLDTPAGRAVVPAEGPGDSAGFVSQGSAGDRYAKVEIQVPEGAAGQWSLAVDPSFDPQDAAFCVMSDLLLEVVPGYEVPSGESGTIDFRAEGRDGAEVSLADFADLETSVDVIGSDGGIRAAETEIDHAAGLLRVTTTADPTDGRLDLTLSTTPITASGLRLTPVTVREVIVPAMGEFYPEVAPLNELVLSDARRTEAATGSFQLTGSSKGPSSVCFAAPLDLRVPVEAGSVLVTYRQECVDLEPGQVEIVEVSAAASTALDGPGSLKIPVTRHPAPGPDVAAAAITADVPVYWRFTNPANVAAFWITVLGVALISLLIPFAALILANRLAARYDVGALRVATVDVLVSSTGPRRRRIIEEREASSSGGRGGSGRVLVDAGEPRKLHVREGRRSLTPGMWGRTVARTFRFEGLTFRARSGWQVFMPPQFTVEAPRGQVLLSNISTSSGGRVAQATPGLGFLTLLVLDERSVRSPSDGAVPGKLVVILQQGAISDDGVDLAVKGSQIWQKASDLIAGVGGSTPSLDDGGPPPSRPRLPF